MAKIDSDDYGEDTGEQSPPLANSAARAETIRNACRQITELEGTRREASEAIRNVKKTLIKGDLDMKISDFNIALRLYQLEGEDRDQLFDTLKETFAALGQGQQLGFLDALRPEQHAGNA
jgi:hypothetical protein